MPNRTATSVMTKGLVTLSPGTEIHEAVKTLLRHKISGAPVVDENRRLLGILSEKDCLRVFTGEAYDGLPEGHVRDYMTREVDTVSPDTTLIDIVGRFLAKSYRRLPVVNEAGVVVGQISRRDALVAIDEMRENSYLYGTKSRRLKPDDGSPGVHSAIKAARNL